jgi:hypothetical protein
MRRSTTNERTTVEERRLMQELVRAFRMAPPDKLAALLRSHSVVAGHCDACHTIWPCTLWSAATKASRPTPVA